MKNSKLAVLITSCDAYEDVWDPFFMLLDRYWTDIPYRVYLNTETKQYNKRFNHFQVETLTLSDISVSKNISWSQRMKLALERIDEEYVFILIEDFFLRERVQTELIEKIISMMDSDQQMGSVQLFGTRINCDNQRQNIQSSTLDIFKIEKGFAKVVFVPTIWRKKTLLKWLRPHESIWAFESCGSKRAYRWKYKEQSYRVNSPSIFNYLWEKDCYCVVNGRWMLHPLLTSLFEENNIVIDYSLRGTITMEQWKSVSLMTHIKRKGLIKTVKGILGRILSIF